MHIYTCILPHNHRGHAVNVSIISPTDVLNAPVTELVTVNTTALRVSWFEPFAHTGFPILNYTLIIRSTADHSAPLYNASLSALEYVLTTDSVHRDCHNITFEIIATNSIGPSAAGVAIGGFPIRESIFMLMSLY